MLHRSGLRLAALAATAAVGLACLPAADAGAATMTACVKKSSGEMRLKTGAAAKRKCRKGWKKVTWKTTGQRGTRGATGLPGAAGLPGAPGAQGPTAPAFTVRDAHGAVVGQLLSMVPESTPIYVVLRDGGIYWYMASGHLSPTANPVWRTPDCSGTAYSRGNKANYGADVFARLLGGPHREVFRTMEGGSIGPASAWKAAGPVEDVSAVTTYYRDDETGACTAYGAPYTGLLAPLVAIPAPPDFTGPLTLG